MATVNPPAGEPRLSVKIRILFGPVISLGPGKADLLEAIERTGSIAAAGRSMNMSYRRAWSLVNEMNRSFRSPLVEAIKGGRHGGGARVTPLGREVLKRYRRLCAAAQRVAEAHMEGLRSLMADAPPENET